MINGPEVVTAPWMRTNTAGNSPFVADDPLQLNDAFFGHVDAVLEHAATNRQYVLLCAGQVLRDEVREWHLIDPARAYRFGRLVGQRLARHSNVVWNVGQDFPARGENAPGGDATEVIRALAEGIADANSPDAVLDGSADIAEASISYHPNGKHGSGEWFHAEPWLAFNLIQSGHDFSFPNHRMITEDFQRTPPKPVVDSEPAYENHPASFNAANGRIQAYHVRRHAYWAVFAGAAGHTYGHNDVWSFRRASGTRPLAYGETDWKTALHAPGAEQMRHLRGLLESVPFNRMRPDLRLVLYPPADDRDLCPALCGARHALVYVPSGQAVTIKLAELDAAEVQASWFDARTGKRTTIGVFDGRLEQVFEPPGHSREGNDSVLMLEVVRTECQ